MDPAGRHLTDDQEQQVRELWGEQLQPIPADLLGPHVPPATRAFLTEVGLPTTGVYGFAFVRDDQLSAPIRHPTGRYLAVSGDGISAHLVVDCESEQMWELFVSDPAPDRFINSNLGYFVLFTGIYCSRIGEPPIVTWQEAELISIELREQFAETDPASINGTDTWWNAVLADITRG